MTCPTRRAFAALAIGAGAVFAACSSDQTAPRTPLLSQAQADSVAAVVTADVEGELDAGTATSGFGFVPGAPFSGALPSLSGSCTPQISPLPVTNSDGDRVPDSIRIVFTACVIDFRRGADTVRGTIDLVDPTPTGTDGSIKLAFTDLTRVFVGRDDRRAAVTQNGTRLAIRDTTVLSQTETDFRTDYAFADGSAASHVRDWTAAFTADIPGSIVRDAPLPSGTLIINGSSSLTRNGTVTFDLHVTTPAALHYDAACTDRPRFTAGTLVVEVTRQGATGTITVAFTGCGQYTVTRG